MLVNLCGSCVGSVLQSDTVRIISIETVDGRRGTLTAPMRSAWLQSAYRTGIIRFGRNVIFIKEKVFRDLSVSMFRKY